MLLRSLSEACGLDDSFGGRRYVDSEGYRQNLRLPPQTHTMRSMLLIDMQASIARIDQENRTLAEMADGASNPELGEVYGDEQRKKRTPAQCAGAASQSHPGRPVSGHEAQALDKVIKHSVDSLQGEFTLLFSRYAEWLTAASSFNTLRASERRP